MGLIILESGDHLGYVIKKNPASGMQKRQVRFCEMSGMYKLLNNSNLINTYQPHMYQPHTYLIHGADYGGCSFSIKDSDEDRYLNALCYSSAVFVISAISAFFETPLKKQETVDIQYNHTFFINSLQISDKQFGTIEKLLKYFNNISIESVKKSVQRSVTFKCENNTLHYFLNVIFVLMVTIISLTNEQFDITDSFVEKIINCMNRIDAPYFVRYYFVSRIISLRDFNKYKKLLEQHSTQKIKLFYGSTLDQRIFELQNKLSFVLPIVDIGCGEGNYLNNFATKIKTNNIKYIGYDIDLDELNRANAKIIKKEITSAVITDNINVVFEFAKNVGLVEVLITEVIEHMELDKVKEFIENIINNVNFKKVLITTPNHDFNTLYNMDTIFRHHDHKWELGSNEFKNFIKNITLPFGYVVRFFEIGDVVDGICCTLGAEIIQTK